jgi:preprotein translocase subunit SecA
MTVAVQSGEQLEQAAEDMEVRAERISNVTYTAPTETGEAETKLDESTARQPALATAGVARVGRNEPCPCGSGKKYKQCHGKLA